MMQLENIKKVNLAELISLGLIVDLASCSFSRVGWEYIRYRFSTPIRMEVMHQIMYMMHWLIKASIKLIEFEF